MRKHLPLTLALGAAVMLYASSRMHAQQASSGYAFLKSAAQVRGFVAAAKNGGGYVPGETLVKFRDGYSPAEQTRALSAVRRNTDGASTEWIGDVLLVKTPANPDAVSVADTLARQPEVEWAQPNYIRRQKARPNDPQYSLQWNFDLLDLPRAWDINGGSASTVTVAVVDSGVTTTNDTLAFTLWTGSQFDTVNVAFHIDPDIAAGRIKPGRDFAFWNGPVVDTDGHGTHVASTALQDTNNNFGTAGIAYRATLLPVKSCLSYWDLQFLMSAFGEPGFLDPDITGFCDDADIAAGIRYAADSSAQVINLSLGSADPAPLLLDAINYAVSHGSIVAMAVGNEFQQGNPVEYPAAYAQQIDGAIAVGAVGRSSKRAFYSNTGPYVEVVAPGGDDTDGGNNGMIAQYALLFTDFTPGVIRRPRFDRYAVILSEGTSMATPHVSGVAALLFSQGITKPAAIESAIEKFATDLGTRGRDNEYGFGLVNARAALRGMGLIK